MHNFEKASKEQLRFMAPGGVLSMEDLWHIKIDSLDTLTVGYSNQLENSERKSFIKSKPVGENKNLQLRFDVAKRILDIRIEESEKAEKAKARKANNAKIMELIADKESDKLKDSSLDELRAMLKDEDD